MSGCEHPSHIRYGPKPLTEKEIRAGMDRAVAIMTEKINQGRAPMLRCKMKVSEVTHVKDDKGQTTQERVSLNAVHGNEGSENAKWSKWTPSASFTIHISNPDAMNKLSSGHEFYVDFTPVSAE